MLAPFSVPLMFDVHIFMISYMKHFQECGTFTLLGFYISKKYVRLSLWKIFLEYCNKSFLDNKPFVVDEVTKPYQTKFTLTAYLI